MTYKCTVVSVNNRLTTKNITFEVNETFGNPGASIFEQQTSIPDYDPSNFYLIDHDGVKYDIDRVGWKEIAEPVFTDD